MTTYRAFLGLGSNMGDRHRMLQRAADAIRMLPGVRIVWYSSVYETDPFGKAGQPKFLNAVGEIETTTTPAELLREVKGIEERLGRISHEPWGPREIDVDVLLYDGLVQNDEQVKVPHPGLAERRFVLVPFREIAPDVVHPVSGLTIEDLAGRCRDEGRVVKTSYRIIP